MWNPNDDIIKKKKKKKTRRLHRLIRAGLKGNNETERGFGSLVWYEYDYLMDSNGKAC